MTTPTPAHASMSRSLKLSPTAITSARSMPRSAARRASVAPLVVSAAQTSTSEKSRARYSVSEIDRRRADVDAPRGDAMSARIGVDAAVEGDLNRILDERVLERGDLFDESRGSSRRNRDAIGMRPVEPVVDHLPLARPIEQQQRAVAPRRASPSSTSRAAVARQQPADERLARARARNRAVVDDQRQRIGQRRDGRQREAEAAAGDDGDVHAARGGLVERLEVRRRHAGRGCRATCRRRRWPELIKHSMHFSAAFGLRPWHLARTILSVRNAS